jgi:glycosyltransferase involved in cell wall biosynthesis
MLIPVANAALWLHRAIASLERQSFADFEVVTVDDGCDDGTEQVLEAWAVRDPRVRVLRQERSGLVVALQRGLAAWGRGWSFS